MKGSSIYDVAGNRLYYYKPGSILLGTRKVLYNSAGADLAYIRNNRGFAHRGFQITTSFARDAEVVKIYGTKYAVEGWEWTVVSEDFNHEFSICSKRHFIARIKRECGFFREKYIFDISKEENVVRVISVLLALRELTTDYQRDHDD